MAKKPAKRKADPKVLGILGVGLDGDDGVKRITRTEEMVLLGGSSETHEQMQETAIKFSEELEKRGKTLENTSPQEVFDLIKEARHRSR